MNAIAVQVLAGGFRSKVQDSSLITACDSEVIGSLLHKIISEILVVLNCYHICTGSMSR